MKLTNKQLAQSVKGLVELGSVKLPVKTSFKVAQASRKVDNALEDYQKILKQINEDFKDTESNNPDYLTALEELLDCEVEVDIEPVDLESLGEVDIEPTALYHLDWLIKS